MYRIKKLLKSFTFWFLLISILEIIMHQIGQDSKSIVLIGFNPILHKIAYSHGAFYDFMESGIMISCHTITGNISIYWYIGAVLTFFVYGILLDLARWLYHQFHKK